VVGGEDWKYLPYGEDAAAFLREARPAKTTSKYNRWVLFWQDFCRHGDGRGRVYLEFEWSLSKWYLFLGYLKQYTEDRDLNVIRSALNRHLSDKRQGWRPIVGVDVSRTIQVWGAHMDAKKRARGEEPRLNRVPCAEAAVVKLVVEGEVASGIDLGWRALMILMLLCWLRADSVAGLQKGDCVLTADLAVTVAVRHMKMRPEFRTNPGIIEIAAPATDPRHWRRRAVNVLRRASSRYPGWVTLLSDRVTPSNKGGSAAAGIMTAELRRLCAGVLIPAGCVTSSHSWREMGAVNSYFGDHNLLKMCARGFWRKPDTMWQSYIEPFLWFPRSAILIQLYDDLH